MMKKIPLQVDEQGFTLLEMMIVVAILGILAVIAGPAYTNYMEKGDVTDAKSELIKIHEVIAKDRIVTPGALSTSADVLARAQGVPLNSNVNAKYTIGVATSTVDTLTAVPRSGNSRTYGVRVDKFANALFCKDSDATTAATVDTAKCKEKMTDF